MEYRVLGKTGLNISRLGFGGIPIQRIDAEGTKALMQQLKDAGVNFIDTARGYTVSEQYLGYALEGIRDKFVLATKSMSRTKEAMAKDIDISLGNLIIDRLAFKEFIQDECNSEALVTEIRELIENQERKTKMLADYADIRNALGGTGASSAVAKAMIEELRFR